jgi:hypothetical protein
MIEIPQGEYKCNDDYILAVVIIIYFSKRYKHDSHTYLKSYTSQNCLPLINGWGGVTLNAKTAPKENLKNRLGDPGKGALKYTC